MPHAQFFFGGTPLTPLAVGQGTQPPPAVTAAERNAAPAAAKFFTFRSPISYEGEIFVLLERGTSPGQPSLGGAPPWHPLSKPLLLLQLGKVANPARQRPGNANGEAAQANRSSSKPLKDKKEKKRNHTYMEKAGAHRNRRGRSHPRCDISGCSAPPRAPPGAAPCPNQGHPARRTQPPPQGPGWPHLCARAPGFGAGGSQVPDPS